MESGARTAQPIYDRIGIGYATTRRADPRIAAQVHRHLGDAVSVLNVGAGTGSYEPADRRVIAVEPSSAMIAQRASSAAPVVRGVAGALPFADGTFDAAMASLTVHHWDDPAAGLRELRRVTSGPVVVFTFDKTVHDHWLVADYLPEMADLDADLPTPEAIADGLGGGVIEVVPVPRDCSDGFGHAFWARPDAYLDPAARAGISAFARLPDDVIERAVGQLAADIESGAWHRANAALLEQDEIDGGYRLVISPPT